MKNYSRYKKMTDNKDWKGICKLNDTDININKIVATEAIGYILNSVVDDEVVFGFTTGVVSHNYNGKINNFILSTWVIVLTDKRFLCLDSEIHSQSINVYNIHNIFHKDIHNVKVSQGFMFGKLTIETNNHLTTIDNCDQKSIMVIGDLANKWLQVLYREDKNTIPKAAINTGENDFDKLIKLAKLKDYGLVSNEEFEENKIKIMKKLLLPSEL